MVAGLPGVEQFIIDKIGNIDIRQVLDLPMPRRGFPIVPVAIGLAVVVVVAVAVVFVVGGGGDGGETPAAPGQTGTRVPPTAAFAPGPTTAAAFVSPVEPKPTRKPAAEPTKKPAPTPIPTPTAMPTYTPYPTYTPWPTPTPTLTPVPAGNLR